jgi:hypothetical protein
MTFDHDVETGKCKECITVTGYLLLLFVIVAVVVLIIIGIFVGNYYYQSSIHKCVCNCK